MGVRRFQDVLIDLGVRRNLPGFVNDTGGATYREYADHIVNHQRQPGLGPLAGLRGPNGKEAGISAPDPR